jgi:hypothetical protein
MTAGKRYGEIPRCACLCRQVRKDGDKGLGLERLKPLVGLRMSDRKVQPLMHSARQKRGQTSDRLGVLESGGLGSEDLGQAILGR